MSTTALILSACDAAVHPSPAGDLSDEEAVLVVLSDQSSVNKEPLVIQVVSAEGQ